MKQMEFGLLKIKSELSGKKMGQSHENLSSLGNEVVVDGETKALSFERISSS
jgi:lysyl-tRNA synthetase class 2